MANKKTDSGRLESALAYIFIACVALSVLALLVLLLATFTAHPEWAYGLGLLPMLALPFGFACLAGVFILSSRRKRKEKK